jgi:hypothetical protein
MFWTIHPNLSGHTHCPFVAVQSFRGAEYLVEWIIPQHGGAMRSPKKDQKLLAPEGNGLPKERNRNYGLD